jgi:3-oxoacyl-[acyl-carrier protein] reductase
LSAASAFVSAQPLRVSASADWSGVDSWERPLSQKVALVTGAARGIGEATARILASEGAHVVCLDRPQDDEQVSKVARDIGGTPLLADVSDHAAAGYIASELHRLHGGVDVVVHNAGITRDRTLARMDERGWDQVIGINLEAVVRITEALIEGGVLRDHGRIVSLSSVAGIAGNMGQTNYAATKAGVIGFTRHLSKQLRSRGITVNAVAPGVIATDMSSPAFDAAAIADLVPMKRAGTALEVASLVRYLASNDAGYITGQVISISGGFT